jgi:hypothetical protein
VTRLGSTLEEIAAMQTTLAVLCVLLGGVLVLIPVLFLVLLLVMPRRWDRPPLAVMVLILLVAAFAALRSRYSPSVVFAVGSVLLAYGLAGLAHASGAVTLSAMGIALLCSILLWGGLYLVGTLQERRRRGRFPTETVS